MKSKFYAILWNIAAYASLILFAITAYYIIFPEKTDPAIQVQSRATTYTSNAQQIGLTASSLSILGIPSPSEQKLFCHYFVDQDQARKAYNAGHTYLDGDHDGEVCESIRFRDLEQQEMIEHYYLSYLD